MKKLQTTGKYKLDVLVDDDWADRLRYARLYGLPARDQPGIFYVTVVLPGGRADFLSRVIMQPPPGMEVDHLDYDPLNNTRVNLFVCTPAQNRQRRRYAPGESGFIGVHADTRNGLDFYRAHLKVSGKRIDLGRSDTPDGAAQVYNAGARKFYGEHARVNLPDEMLSLEEAREKYKRGVRAGRRRTRPEKASGRSRGGVPVLDAHQVAEVLDRLGRGEKAGTLAKEYRVSWPVITKVKNGTYPVAPESQPASRRRTVQVRAA